MLASGYPSSPFSLLHSGQCPDMSYSGGFSPGVPPLPIPNREVKPGRADGTAPQCGRVGRRLLSGEPSRKRGGSCFLCSFSIFFQILRRGEDASDEERKAWMKWKDTKEMYMNQVDMVDGNLRKVLSFGRMR